jgi:hypothetical protein
VLLLVLHDDQAANAENVPAAQFDRPPFDLHAHGARVVVDLGDVAEDLSVYFCADGFSEMLGELWVFNLAGEGLLYAEGGALVELYVLVSIEVSMNVERRTFQDLDHGAVIYLAEAQTLQNLAVDVHEHVECSQIVRLP